VAALGGLACLAQPAEKLRHIHVAKQQPPFVVWSRFFSNRNDRKDGEVKDKVVPFWSSLSILSSASQSDSAQSL
jgi:hypothetical protein